MSLEYGETDVVFNSVLVSVLDVCLCSFEPWHVFHCSIFYFNMFLVFHDCIAFIYYN